MADLVLNPQIVQAVDFSNKALSAAAASEGIDIVRGQVAQAAGLAIQDVTDNIQQMLVLEAAVTGRAMAMLLAEPEKAAQALLALETMQAAVQKSIGWMTQIGQAASGVVSGFPSGD